MGGSSKMNRPQAVHSDVLDVTVLADTFKFEVSALRGSRKGPPFYFPLGGVRGISRFPQ